MAPTIADIEAARERLAGISRVTPLYPTETFSRLTREIPASRSRAASMSAIVGAIELEHLLHDLTDGA